MEEKFGSKTAFIMASVGSAVGLGNVFRFPSLAVKYGLVFLPVYTLLLVFLGLPLVLSELALGRAFGSNPQRAFNQAKKTGKTVGRLSLLNCFIVMSYYTLLFSFVLAQSVSSALEVFSFKLPPKTDFSEPGLFFVFISWCLVLLCFGSANRLGKISTVGMVASCLILISLALFCALKSPEKLSLFCHFTPSFLFLPSFWLDAVGQVFFSLSVTVGVMVAYGAFLDKKESLAVCSAIIAFFDMGVSLVATVIYACVSPSSLGTTQSLSVYSSAFSSFGPLGTVFSFLFYLSLAFLCLDSVEAYLKSVVLGLSGKILGKEQHRAFAVAFFSTFFGVIILFFGLTDFLDAKVAPFLALLVGFGEAVVFAKLSKEKTLYSEIFIKNRPFLWSFYRFCVTLVIPPLLALLFLSEFFFSP